MIKLHDNLWYIISDNSEYLAYMTHYENNKAFEKRRETGVRWAKNICWTEQRKSDEEYGNITPNTPTSGFTITDSVSRWSTQNKLFRVQDPRGFTVEVPTGNISTLLGCTTVVNGIIQEECVWGRDGNNHVLLPTTSEPYLEAKEKNKIQNERISITKLNVGDTFLSSVDDPEEYASTYLGKAKITWEIEKYERRVKQNSGNYSYRTVYESSDTRLDKLAGQVQITDTKWCHVYACGNYFYLTSSKKVIPLGKVNKIAVDTKRSDVSIWAPERLTKNTELGDIREWMYNSDEYYFASEVKSIEWKDEK